MMGYWAKDAGEMDGFPFFYIHTSWYDINVTALKPSLKPPTNIVGLIDLESS
jgi:hypothetical protein